MAGPVTIHTRSKLARFIFDNSLLLLVGTIAAVALAVSSLGLSLERLTLVASALSVGIGFGLQSVVSNFVSGLILLWERPIRVGDQVLVGAVKSIAAGTQVQIK